VQAVEVPVLKLLLYINVFCKIHIYLINTFHIAKAKASIKHPLAEYLYEKCSCFCNMCKENRNILF